MASTYIKLPCDSFGETVDIIDDNVITLDKTWSSFKINDELDDIRCIYVRSTRFESISSGTSGTLTLTGSQAIILNDFGGTTDAVVTTIEGGRPTNFPAEDASGNIIAATLDAGGNWTLSNTPSAYPVGIVFRVRQKFEDYDDFDSAVMGGLDLQIIAERDVNITYGEVTAVPAASLTTVATYVATGGEKLLRALTSGTNIAEYRVQVNGSTVAKGRTNYGDDLTSTMEFEPGLTLAAADAVTVKVIHQRTGMSGDFNASIITEN